MHTQPLLQDWKVTAVNSNCVAITISPDLSLEGVKFKVLSETRSFLFELTPQGQETVFCAPTGKPMFVELHSPSGVSVHYVEGSGNEFYNTQNN
jgi:hypothetical protein